MRTCVMTLAFVLLAVSCDPGESSGPEEEPDATQEGSGVGDGAEAAQASVDCAPGEADGDLRLANWPEYIDPQLITAFEDAHELSVTLDVHTSNERLLERVQADGTAYDVVVASDYMVSIMIEEGLLAPMDHDLLANSDNVHEGFTDPPYDPGNTYSMPYQWGTTGIGVDLGQVGDDVEASWDLIFDPDLAAEHGGAITLLDDPREAMAAALYQLGYSPNTTVRSELEEAADLIGQAGDHVAGFASSGYADRLVRGELAVAHGYVGDHLRAFAGADGRFAYLIPEEGATKWVDAMAVLADAPHRCTAYAFVDFLLDAENGARLTNWNRAASPNGPAEEFIELEILEDPAIYPPDDVQLHFLEHTGDAEGVYRDLFGQARD